MAVAGAAVEVPSAPVGQVVEHPGRQGGASSQERTAPAACGLRITSATNQSSASSVVFESAAVVGSVTFTRSLVSGATIEDQVAPATEFASVSVRVGAISGRRRGINSIFRG